VFSWLMMHVGPADPIAVRVVVVVCESMTNLIGLSVIAWRSATMARADAGVIDE
jgi:hypothetical protein